MSLASKLARRASILGASALISALPFTSGCNSFESNPNPNAYGSTSPGQRFLDDIYDRVMGKEHPEVQQPPQYPYQPYATVPVQQPQPYPTQYPQAAPITKELNLIFAAERMREVKEKRERMVIMRTVFDKVGQKTFVAGRPMMVVLQRLNTSRTISARGIMHNRDTGEVICGPYLESTPGDYIYLDFRESGALNPGRYKAIYEDSEGNKLGELELQVTDKKQSSFAATR